MNSGTTRGESLEHRRTHANTDVFNAYPEGSPQLVAYMHNNSDLLINHRLGYLLFIRVPLNLQREIAGLEEEVHDLDVHDSANIPRSESSND